MKTDLEAVFFYGFDHGQTRDSSEVGQIEDPHPDRFKGGFWVVWFENKALLDENGHATSSIWIRAHLRTKKVEGQKEGVLN